MKLHSLEKGGDSGGGPSPGVPACMFVSLSALFCEHVRNPHPDIAVRGTPREPFSDPFLQNPIPFRSSRPLSVRDSIRVCRTLYAFLLFVRGSIVRVIPLPD